MSENLQPEVPPTVERHETRDAILAVALVILALVAASAVDGLAALLARLLVFVVAIGGVILYVYDRPRLSRYAGKVKNAWAELRK